MPVIQIGLMGLGPDHSVGNATTKENQILRSVRRDVTATQRGSHWAFGGAEVDEPEKFWAFSEFDYMEHPKDLTKPSGTKLVKDLPSILKKWEFQKHITIDSDLRPALEAPVIEVLLVYFPSDISALDQANISTLAKDIINSGLATCKDAKAASFGWSLENDCPVLGRSAEVGSLLAVLIGWTSVDAAETFWEEKDQTMMFQEIVKVKEALELVCRFVKCRKLG